MWWGAALPSDVLVVCTGNVCRSPYVTQQLHDALPELRVASGGTRALVGSPPPPQIQAMLRDRGLGPVRTEARNARRRLIRSARLVITAEQRHRVEVVRRVPAAADRTFTLLELARVVREAGAPSGLGLDGLLEVARLGLAADHGRDFDDDLLDPWGLTDAAYERMADLADRALAVLVPVLRATA